MAFPELRKWFKDFTADSGQPIVLDLKTSGVIFGSTEEEAFYRKFPPIYSILGGGSSSWSGEVVSRDTALSNSTVWACYRLISESMGYLPASVKIQSGGAKVDAPNHSMFSPMHNAPNAEMSAQTFKEILTGHCMLDGDGFAKILRRSGTGAAIELQPLLPERVKLDREKTGQKRLVYVSTNERGSADATYTVERGKPHDIFHLRGLSRDGLRGYNVREIAKQSIGTALAAERNVARFWAAGGRVPYLLEMEGKFKNDEDARKFRQEWEAIYSQPHRAPIAEQGIKYKQTGLSMADAQASEFRLSMVSEVCRWWGVSPHLAGDLSRATFSNIEQLFLEFKTICISRWAKRWEQDFWRCVLTPNEQSDGYFLKINIDALLRADFAARMAGHASALQNGHKNIDEVRDLEDMNPLPDGAGSAYHIQLNMAAIGKDGQVQSPQLVRIGQAKQNTQTTPTKPAKGEQIHEN